MEIAMKSMLGKQLEKTLLKCKKAELVDVIVEFAQDDRGIMRQLESRFEIKSSPKELVTATRQAIADATDFDERDMNSNFDYDYEAYSAVKRSFGQLIKLGQLREVMDLSLELMKEGSSQVEMSDEGLMTEEIEECLQVVIRTLKKKSDLAASDVVSWCEEMIYKDRVGFICDKELRSLQVQYAS